MILDALHEPMTFITDVILALEGFLLGHLLFWNYSKKQTGIIQKNFFKLWAFAFLFLAFGSLLGGIYHGYKIQQIWPLTILTIGVASFYLLLAIITQFFSSYKTILYPLAVLKLLILGIAMNYTLKFQLVIFDYLPVLLLLLGVYGYDYIKTKKLASLLVAAGVVVSLLGSLIQVMHLAPSEKFNHNDLYHVFSMVSLFLMYQGVIRQFAKQESLSVSSDVQ